MKTARFLRSALLALACAPSLPAWADNPLTAHLDCAATFIHTAQRYQEAGQDGSMFGELAVRAMSDASSLSSTEAVHADLRQRVPAQKAAHAKRVAEQGADKADEHMLSALRSCGQRYGAM